MDAKEIKQSLREAKEAIKNKDVEKALNLCKAILKADGTNYLALVIFGAALQESNSKDEAISAYRKAIDLSPDQVLAWQGLASYYEKEKTTNYINLVPVYTKLILLEKEITKKKDICLKLTALFKNLTEDCSISELASLLDNSEIQPSICDLFLQYFTFARNVSERELNDFRKTLVLKNDYSSIQIETFVKYFTALCRAKRYEQLFEDCQEFGFSDTENIELLEIFCEAFCFSSITDSKAHLHAAEEYYERLLQKKEDSFFGLIAKAINLLAKEEYVSCRVILIDVIDRYDEHWLVHWYLSKVYLGLYCFDDAVTSLLAVKRSLPSVIEEIRCLLDELLIKASSSSKNPEHCLLCLKISEKPHNDSSTVFYLKSCIRACITLEKWDVVSQKMKELTESGIDDPEVKFLSALFVYKCNGDVQKAVSDLQNGIREETEFLDCWLLLGELFWLRKNFAEAVNCYFKAGKLAPHVYVSFVYLGHYYRDVLKNLQKARRCYEKAYQLSMNLDEIAEALSDIYRQLDCQENNFNLLSGIASTSGKRWAWLRLGLNHLDSGNPKLAVNCFLSAIRGNENDYYCQQLLADAYFARGAYTSALKSYQKCLDLNPSSLYASIQLATVKQRVGLHDESIAQFRLLVQNNPNCLLALKGLSEACLKEARDLFRGQMLGCARDLCQEASIALTSALKQNAGFACIWKLFADICVLVCQLPKNFSYLSLPSFLFEKHLDSDVETRQLIRADQLLNFSLKCYLAAIHLSGDNKSLLGYLWHDIAICYNLQANLAEADQKLALRKSAFAAVKRSVSLDPKVWTHWNLMGVLSLSAEINNPMIAQHCFIKSVKLEYSSAISWSNLGTLYLQHNHVQLANEAFQKAQSVDPKYPRSWIGQAIIAEYVDHDETADLFYHCAGLGYHQESSKGLSEWVCKILKNWDQYKDNFHCTYLIEKMFGVQTAVTCLNWYTTHNPNDSCASNTLSVLYEMCGLFRNATAASKNAMKLVPDELADIVRSNLGRQLRKKGDYEDAAEVYRLVKEVDFSIQCDLALSLFLAGKYEEASSHYDAAIHWLAPDDGCVAQVMVATAALHYLTNKKAEAQTILFKCIHLKPVPVYGLFAACAFGILNKEIRLSKLVLKELDAIERNPEYIPHVAFFHAYCEILQGNNSKMAVKKMSKFLFAYPGNATLWLNSCLLLNNLATCAPKEYTKCAAAAAHANCAISLGRGKIDISKITSIVSLSHLMAGNAEKSLSYSSKAVFLYPNVAENWAVLIAVQYSRGRDYPSVRNTIKFVQENLVCTKPLIAWLTKIDQKIATIIKGPFITL